MVGVSGGKINQFSYKMPLQNAFTKRLYKTPLQNAFTKRLYKTPLQKILQAYSKKGRGRRGTVGSLHRRFPTPEVPYKGLKCSYNIILL
jgi:hypothetical protein